MAHARIAKIMARDAHPFAQLQQLKDAGYLRDVQKFENPSSTISSVEIVVLLHNGKVVSETASACGKSAAKETAARAALNLVVGELTSQTYEECHDSCHQEPQDTCTTANHPQITPKQARQMAEDAANLQTLTTLIENHFAPQSSGPSLLVSIDLEQYERDTNITLEVGIAIMSVEDCLQNRVDRIRTFHFVNLDQLHLQNGQFCADNRENFLFGSSQLVPESRLADIVGGLLDFITTGAACVTLVGHTVLGDLQWLQNMGINVSGFNRICDIARIYRNMSSPSVFSNQSAMDKILKSLGLDDTYLHNGGNDAHYNLLVLQRLTVPIISACLANMKCG